MTANLHVDDRASGAVRRCAVLGHPIEHSLSPVLHRAAYKMLGLDWEYTACDVAEPELAAFLASRDDTWVGVSLTMPLKVEVLDLLTTASPDVRLARAANTVLFDGGLLHGHNTDIPGLVGALGERGVRSVGEATVVGTGATARSAVVALAQLGASTVHVVGRSPAGLADLASLAGSLGLAVHEVGFSGPGRREAMSREVVVTTVPSAAAPSLVPEASAGASSVLFDVLYDPWPTPLAAAWPGKVLGGLDLLVHQAVGQIELMTGHLVAVDELRAAGAAALRARAGTASPQA